MDTIKRLTVKTLPKGKISQQHYDNAMVHRYVAAEGKTLCGRAVGAEDGRWVANRRGAEADINCQRCIKRMQEDALGAGASKPAGKTAKGTRGKRSAKKDGQSKAAQRVAKETAFNPVPKPTRKRTRKVQAEAETPVTFGEALL